MKRKVTMKRTIKKYKNARRIHILTVGIIVFLLQGVQAQSVLSVSPTINNNQVVKDANIVMTFSTSVTLSASNMIVTGSQTGLITGSFSNNRTSMVTFDPATDFKPGELVTVQLTGATGLLNPYNFSFRVQPTANPINSMTPLEKNVVSTLPQLIDVASGDLDGDGDIDLIAVSYATSELVWLQNDGAAQPTFTAQPALYDGADTEKLITVVLGDANNDGDLDIFFGAEEADKIFFIENNGNGTFGAVTEINSGTADGLAAVFLGDLDSDGFIDILASSAADNTLAWYKGNGDNTFGSETIISTSLGGAFSVKVGDMDNDGDLDVIGGAMSGDEIRWYANNGSGVFSTNTLVASAYDGVSSVSVGDIDGDGDLDIAASSINEDKISWFENTGSGAGFTERDIPSPTEGAENAINVDLKDMDGDGDLDILWAADERPVGRGSLAWSRNDGGSPVTWTYILIDALGRRGYSVDAADLTGDGKLEFIGTALGGSGGANFPELSWYKLNVPAFISTTPSINSNNAATNADIVMTFITSVTLSASNTFVTGSQSGLVSGTFSNNGTTATFNPTSDFKPGELITVQLITAGGGPTSPYNFSFQVQPASNQITVATPIQKNVVSTIPKLIDVASGDLDGDGDIDLIAVSHATSELIWLQNDGTAQPSFIAQPALYDGADTEELMSVVLGDADNDGDLDIFFGAEIADKIFFIENTGGGTFGAVTEINSGTADGLSEIFLGDLDSDGLIDVLTATRGNNRTSWYKNNGGNNFGSETIIYANQETGFSIKVGDMDNDGDLDIISAGASNAIQFFINEGNGVFSTFRRFIGGYVGATNISIGDIDGDGDLDFAATAYDADRVSWFENTGAGVNFTERIVYHDASGTSSDRMISVDLKDMDGDGDLDILWAADVEAGTGGAIGTLGWSRNDGGLPVTWTYIPVDTAATRGYSVDAADLDGNGTLEFIGAALGDAGGTGAALSWYDFESVFVSATPSVNSTNAAINANIAITFSTAMTLSSNNMIVTGSQTGLIAGSFSNNGTSVITFDPATDFKPGELVTVQLTGATGLLNPYNYSFRVQPTANPINSMTPLEKNVVSTLPQLIDVASGDLDGDGDIDLIAVSYATSELVWLQNDGAAQPTFTAQPALYDGADTEKLITVVLGDANNDGDLDIFFGAEEADKIFFIENNGNGTFGAVTEINSGTADGLATVFLGDLDGDGLIDVLAASQNDSTLAWYKGNGDNTFGSETIISTSLGGAFSVKVGDMDNDGDLDVIGGAMSGDEIRWYANNGSGVFSTNTLVASAYDGVSSVSVGDIDGDGDLDIAASSINEDKISWFENIGSGTSFTERDIPSPTEGAENAINVDLKDMDGDGDLDILWAADERPVGRGSLAWSRNDGGSPVSWTYILVDALGRRGYSVDAADLTGDGKLEFIGTALGGSGGANFPELSWYKLNVPAFISTTPSINSNNAATNADIVMTFITSVTLSASNTFVMGSQTGKITGTFSNNGTTATFNPSTDFKPGELITVQLITAGGGPTSPYNFSFQVQPASNQITVATPIQKNVVSTQAELIDVASGDLDGDGDIDMVAVSHATSELIWFRSDGATDPTFTAQPALYDGADTEALVSVVLGDANNDGDLDIFFGAEGADKIFFIENQGGGTFGTAVEINSGTADGLSEVFLGDIDGDGLIDILASSQNDNTIAWYKNNDNHNFGSETIIYPFSEGAFSVKVGDMDNDGDLDIITAGRLGNRIRWFISNGNGTFSAFRQVTSTYNGPSSLSVGDIDGDGDLDIAVVSYTQDKVSWFENTGGGVSFTERTVYHDASGTSSDRMIDVNLKDMDGDGDLDILWAADVVPIGSGNIAWSRNDGGLPVTWTYIPVEATASRGYSMDAADLTGDGKLEFIGAALGDSGVGAALSWYKFEPVFVSATPSVNSTNAATDANIEITFSTAITLSSGNTFVTGSQTGLVTGTFSNNGTSTITFDPATDFKPGELITVQLTKATGLESPYNFSFQVQSASNQITASTPIQKNVVSTLPQLIDVASGDLDGDGDIDLIAVSHATSELIWLQNDGAAQPTFTAQPALYDGADTEELITVVLGDANNDGDLDIFFGAEIADKIFFIENQGGGTFGAVTEINSGTANGLATVFLGDLDGDGLIDVLAASQNNNIIAWYKNKGNHTFESEIVIASDLDGTFSVKVGDMDNDGDLDVIGAGYNNDQIRWYANNGSGVFSTSTLVTSTHGGASSVSIGDIDGDGDLDIAATALFENKVSWFENTGSGAGFTERTVYDSSAGAERAINVDLKDMDGDGDLDILWAADEQPIGQGNIVLSLNDGGSPITWTYLRVDAPAVRGYSVDAADLNGDGTLEFIGAALGDSGVGAELSWYMFNVLPFVNIKAYLRGSFNTTSGMMDDGLRIVGIIPTTSPYGDGATCNASVFSVTGNDAIVDWVLVELRDKDNINTVVATQGALLQRDGDVVGTDGSSKVSFAVANGDYYVSVSHRNHITIVSDQAMNLNKTTTSLDLTWINNVRGGGNAVSDLNGGDAYGLIPGDVDANNSVQTTDRTGLIGAIGQNGYSSLDVNMNGQIQTTDLGLLTLFIGKGIQF